MKKINENKTSYKGYFVFTYNNLILLTILLWSSCNQQVKFDKNKWNEQIDPLFPSRYRAKMLNDLTVHNKLVGLNYRQLIESLGTPDNKDSNVASYKIVVEYGSDIDPVYTKQLMLSYSKDSAITSFKIVEWKNNLK